jgi:uncharacterized protein YdhG (YjbR/CyaY superfamily)
MPTRQTTRGPVKKTSETKRPAPRRMAQHKSVDAYLAAVPPDQRRALDKLRAQIRRVAPDATESISYGMPTFKLGGRPLAYFGAASKHLSLYALDTRLPELKSYDTSGKGTIRFTPDKPLPASLVTKLLKARIAALKKGAGY